MNEQKNKEIDAQLKDTQDTFEIAKQSWGRDEAVLK